MKKRNAEGNLCFKKKDYDGALEEYTSALELCRPYGAHMREEMAILHGNTARVSLELRAYDTAFKHATAQLQFDPNSDKVNAIVLFIIHIVLIIEDICLPCP